MKGKGNYLNIKGVLLLSVGFFFLFFGVNAASILTSKALRANGFNNLGFYCLSFLYICYAISSLLFASTFVN
jgi:hypothetical protein